MSEEQRRQTGCPALEFGDELLIRDTSAISALVNSRSLQRTVPLSYSAFGLSLRTNRSIPGLIPRSAVFPSDTQIWLDAVPSAHEIRGVPDDPWYVSGEGDEEPPSLRVWKLSGGACFRLLYDDGTEFFVDRGGSEVWATWPDSSTLEDTATYLLGPILGFVLRLRGITCLHASAVAVGDRAIALLGPEGAGKSTTAAAFSRMGYPVLADDIVALSERGETVRVQPAYPQLRLWPESVALLYGAVDALPLLTPTWDKRALDLTQNGCRFEQRPLPLAAIYVLAERSPDPEPLIDGLQGRESLMTLLANTYVGYLLDATMRGREFESLGRLVSRVPVRRVVPSTDPAQVSRLCDRVVDDCEALGCTASPTTAR